jgi:hypothetical protein
MNRILLLSAFLLGSMLAWGGPPQTEDVGAVPLGTLARQLRANRSDTAKKVVKLFTNDNLPPRPPGEGLSAASGMSSSPTEPAPTQPATGAAAKKTATGEAYFRERKSAIAAQLETHRRELAVLEQKLALGGMQFYADPNQTLQQEYSRSDINKLSDDIAKKKQQIADDEKALDDLRDELRRAGGDPGWLR